MQMHVKSIENGLNEDKPISWAYFTKLKIYEHKKWAEFAEDSEVFLSKLDSIQKHIGGNCLNKHAIELMTVAKNNSILAVP
ncbi:MAG: hypothetical protein P8P83_03005 [Rickettsiaceae bacterium]|nr:hypothetical protein [Rickettsiaceae bacterium]